MVLFCRLFLRKFYNFSYQITGITCLCSNLVGFNLAILCLGFYLLCWVSERSSSLPVPIDAQCGILLLFFNILINYYKTTIKAVLSYTRERGWSDDTANDIDEKEWVLFRYHPYFVTLGQRGKENLCYRSNLCQVAVRSACG